MKCLALFVLSLLLVCPAVAKPAKWTVMVYMTGMDDLEEFAVGDLAEMKKAAASKDINVVVQCKRSGRKFPGVKIPTWDGVLRYRIGETPNPKAAFAGNMADKETLRTFVSWAANTYPADRYALILWCHGAGWRRLELTGNTAVEATEVVDRHRILFAPAGMRDSAFKACAADGNDILMNAEAAEAIAEAMGAIKLDVLAFDSCLMQMMETAYAFRNVARMLVGSEELVPGYGFRYDKWLARLVAAPGSDAGALADIMVAEYKSTYSANGETTLSAIDLSKIPALAAAVSSFADVLRAALPAEAALVTEARKECDVYAPAECFDSVCEGGGFHHIDLRRFADRIAAKTKKETSRVAAGALSRAIDDAVRDHPWAGTLRDAKTNFGSYGLAIYFPLDGKTYDDDEWNDHSYDKPPTNRFQPYPVAFVADHTWADFLHAYFMAVPTVSP